MYIGEVEVHLWNYFNCLPPEEEKEHLFSTCYIPGIFAAILGETSLVFLLGRLVLLCTESQDSSGDLSPGLCPYNACASLTQTASPSIS